MQPPGGGKTKTSVSTAKMKLLLANEIYWSRVTNALPFSSGAFSNRVKTLHSTDELFYYKTGGRVLNLRVTNALNIRVLSIAYQGCVINIFPRNFPFLCDLYLLMKNRISNNTS